MKISFVIPAYNEEVCIPICLSALEQEIGRNGGECETEVIVVNNASTDKTKEIASSFAFTRVVDEPHKGLVWARRAGYLAASGDIIANIDADTKMPTGWLGKVIDEFGRDEKLMALSGPHVFYDASFLTRFIARIFYIVGFIFDESSEFLFHNGSMLQGGNFVLRRTAMEEIGGFDTSIEFYGEDINIGRRVRRIGKVKWTFSLPMNASGRRFEKEGIIMTGALYLLNYLWETFFKKPLSTTYKDIRLKKK
ncbi:MAG: glycosyltransferase family 2 protein [Candidatus Moranbacteria bacterium]|nr:glycosyltransferase family 2 protein [Candidatus Moranbacteria bacterium]